MSRARKTNTSKRQVKSKTPVEGRVGIFWLFEGKVIVHSSSLNEAEPYGDSLTHATGHVDYWADLQRKGVVPPEVEYEEPPRGRVRYDRKLDEFTLYADRCILSNDAIIQQLVEQLHLPKNTKYGTDPHYRCSKCLYGSHHDEDDD